MRIGITIKSGPGDFLLNEETDWSGTKEQLFALELAINNTGELRCWTRVIEPERKVDNGSEMGD